MISRAEIYRPEIFDPEDAFAQSDYEMEEKFPLEEIDDERLAHLASAPNFYGNYQEIDRLPEGDSDEPNPFIQQIAVETIAVLEKIDIEKLRRSTENRYVIDDLVQDVRDDAYLIFDHKRITGIANMLFSNARFEEAAALLTIEGENGERHPKFPNEVSPMVLLATIAEKNRAFGDIVKLLMDKDGKARFPQHKAGMRLLTLALNKMERHGNTVQLSEQFVAEEDMESLLSDNDLFQNYLIALNALGEHEKVLRLCMADGELVLPQHSIKGSILGAVGHALNCLGKHREACRMLEKFRTNAQCRDTPAYTNSLSHALAACGRHREVVELLIDSSGRNYRFPENLTCMRSLGYAFINLGWIREAARLLSWVERESPHDPEAFLSVRNALNRKIMEVRHGVGRDDRIA